MARPLPIRNLSGFAGFLNSLDPLRPLSFLERRGPVASSGNGPLEGPQDVLLIVPIDFGDAESAARVEDIAGELELAITAAFPRSGSCSWSAKGG